MKKIKAVIYGEPGTGKSVFACKAPKPFFICTDPNYEWLEDWGAKEEDHVQVFSWEQAKKEFARDFNGYDTVVVDLVEDLFKWCEYEWCQKNGLQHVADLGYGKGYDITRNEFFIEISKLLNLDKNVLLIMHGLTYTVKDRRGVEYTKYGPTNRIPDKVIDMIEGRVRYFIRAFAKTEEDADGNLITNRYLSLSPDGTTEFGITRGLSAAVPRFIPLEWDTFASVIDNSSVSANSAPMKSAAPVEFTSEPEKVAEAPKTRGRKAAPKVEPVKEAEVDHSELAAIVGKLKAQVESIEDEPEVEETVEEEVKPLYHLTEDLSKVETVKEAPIQETPTSTPVKEEATSNADRIAAIKAKLAALKNK